MTKPAALRATTNATTIGHTRATSIARSQASRKWIVGVSKKPVLLPDDLRALGKNIQARRIEIKMTQAELAKAAGVSERTLLNIENCSMNGWPSSPVFLKISRKLGLPDPELFSTKV